MNKTRKEQNNPDRSTNKKSTESARLPRGGIIWLILILWAAYYLISTFGESKSAGLSYTEFKNVVGKDKVSQITVKGERIVGKFKEPYEVVQESGKDTLTYKRFVTIRPAFEDPELMQLLESHNVVLQAEATDDGTWLRTLLIMLLPWILIVGYFMYIRKRMQGQMKGPMGGGLFSIGKSKAKRYRKSSSEVRFDDVAGLENAKKEAPSIIFIDEIDSIGRARGTGLGGGHDERETNFEPDLV